MEQRLVEFDCEKLKRFRHKYVQASSNNKELFWFEDLKYFTSQAPQLIKMLEEKFGEHYDK